MSALLNDPSKLWSLPSLGWQPGEAGEGKDCHLLWSCWCPSVRTVPGTWQALSQHLLNEGMNEWHISEARHPGEYKAASLIGPRAGTRSHPLCPQGSAQGLAQSKDRWMSEGLNKMNVLAKKPSLITVCRALKVREQCLWEWDACVFEK